jgi:hypothetical protein
VTSNYSTTPGAQPSPRMTTTIIATIITVSSIP